MSVIYGIAAEEDRQDRARRPHHRSPPRHRKPRRIHPALKVAATVGVAATVAKIAAFGFEVLVIVTGEIVAHHITGA